MELRQIRLSISRVAISAFRAKDACGDELLDLAVTHPEPPFEYRGVIGTATHGCECGTDVVATESKR